jgi:Spy/CpxP family protein refolding chaperone
MKTTLRLSLAAALLALTLPAVASAQRGMGGGMGGGANAAERQAQQRARMFEGITLTPEQSAKIDTIQAATRTKRMEMMQGGGGGDRQAMMQQMMEMQNAEAKAIKALLTPEQAAIFDKNREAMMQRRGGGLR